ncbi:SIMPL domain-containing protein [Haloarchaeobius sp. TZWWS8]|uniref:SIMPL domain-containing protein n=1 Tax=Haloarchaeobius sp. TZWWS8 TaxID=3446121 RepID=UPI003EC11883
MNLKLAAALVALLTVSAGCLGTAAVVGDSTPAMSSDEKDTAPTVSVSGVGTVEAAPDEAVIRITVERDGRTADEARTFTAQDATSMRQALRDAGVPDDDVKTTAYYINPRYDYKANNELVGYRAIHSYEVTTDNISRAGELVDIAVKNGAARIDGVTFQLSDEKQRALRSDAITKAVEAAKADADAFVAAADLSIVRLKSASVSGSSVGPYPVYYQRSAEAADASTTLEPGPVEVQVTVTIVYEVA